MDLHARVTGACQQASAGRGHNLAGTHHDVAGMGLLGGRANVLPHFSRRRKAHVRALVAVAVKHLDDLVFHHSIRTLGHRRACHDADSLARGDYAIEHMARGFVPHDGKRHGRIGGRFGEVDGMHGISIHGAVGKRRDVDIGRGVLGQGKTGRLPHGNLDNFGAIHVRQDDRLCVLQRNEFLSHIHL